jgi:hypothetical protein
VVQNAGVPGIKSTDIYGNVEDLKLDPTPGMGHGTYLKMNVLVLVKPDLGIVLMRASGFTGWSWNLDRVVT